MPGRYRVERGGFMLLMRGGYLRMDLCDGANWGRFGRIPEPEDIIGSVLVQGGELKEETYQAMPTYRLVTPEGPMKLSSFLLQKLREKLETEE
jgi:hypothetical protein